MKLTISPTLGELPTIDYRSLTDLQGNLKDLHQKEFDKLKKSLFGTEAKPKMFDFPLYVCEIKGTNYIFDGHQRLRVLKTLNAEPYELPCVFVEAKSIKEAKQKLLTLNSNYGKVTKEGFDEFVATDFDTDFITDFTTFEGFMDFEDVTQETEGEDDVPAEPKNIFVVRGDIFEINANGVKIRVGCLDSTNSDDIEKLMAGQKAQIGFTSPPYNAGNNLRWAKDDYKSFYENNIDSKESKEYIDFCQSVLNNILLVLEGFCFWNVSYNANSRFEYLKVIEPYLEKLNETIVWKKTAIPVGSGLTRIFEFIFVFKNNSKNTHLGKRNETNFNFWEVSNINSQDKDNHRACFPVELPIKAFELCEGNNVLDLFCGTGTTAVACLKNKRNCFTNDISENYVQISVKRLIDFCQTNNFAFDITLNGKPFDTELLN